MIEITGENIPDTYVEALVKLRTCGVEQGSRNGPVTRFPGHVFLTVKDPKERVLFDPVRDANPFFHLMETVWMLAGEEKVGFLLEYNKRMDTWANEAGTMLGAYGYRWQRHFGNDQIADLIYLLRKDPDTRQAILQMWDPLMDGPYTESKDRPCNTQIMFEINMGDLDMTVINRSNDLVWGMMGANAVHMTILHEVVASCIDRPVGSYHVFSKNIHVYLNLPKYDEIIKTTRVFDCYHMGDASVNPVPVCLGGDYGKFMEGCRKFVKNPRHCGVSWLDDVCLPAHLAWKAYQAGNMTSALDRCLYISAPDWQLACRQWLKRRSTV